MFMLTGQQIREIREKFLKITTTALAARLKVSESAVNRWENGHTHPRWETMEILTNEILPEAEAKGYRLPKPVAVRRA
jgi:DNA-binding transcriptional regulator YiaG